MSAGVVLFIFEVIFYFAQGSSIFTRNMIRMKHDSLSENSYISHPEPVNQSTEPDKLTSSAGNGVYQQIVLTNHQLSSNGSDSEIRSLGFHKISSALLNETYPLHLKSPIENSTVKQLDLYNDFNKSKEDQVHSSSQMMTSTTILPYVSHYNPPSTPNMSSEEISKRYWGQYMNFNSSFLQAQANDSVDFKGFQVMNLWDLLSRLYECPWSLEILDCFRNSFEDQIGISSQHPKPQYPRFNVEEDLLNDETNIGNLDADKGRRKLSKKLQMLLPLLIMLKMTMVPALAVMALVSGKAFLVSLLSLGVALFAASVHPAALSASKRHEVAPQAPQTHDQLASNYYYVM